MSAASARPPAPAAVLEHEREPAHLEESVGPASVVDGTMLALLGSPDEVATVLCDVTEGRADTIGLGHWWSRHVTREDADIAAILRPESLGPTEVAYPRLFATDEPLTMKRDELADELENIAEMGWRQLPTRAPHVYQLQVLEPVRYKFTADVEAQGYGVLLCSRTLRAEAIDGKLQHESLYSPCEPGLLRQLLVDFLRNANQVRVSRQRPDGYYGTVDVTLG